MDAAYGIILYHFHSLDELLWLLAIISKWHSPNEISSLLIN